MFPFVFDKYTEVVQRAAEDERYCAEENRTFQDETFGQEMAQRLRDEGVLRDDGAI